MARRLARGARLVLATHNAGKLREIVELLAPHGVKVVSAGALGLPEPEETEPDFVGNARLKARAAALAADLPALADDSGFCVAAIGGAPGVLSARWAGPTRDFAAAMARVHERAGVAEDRIRWSDGRLEGGVVHQGGQVGQDGDGGQARSGQAPGPADGDPGEPGRQRAASRRGQAETLPGVRLLALVSHGAQPTTGRVTALKHGRNHPVTVRP